MTAESNFSYLGSKEAMPTKSTNECWLPTGTISACKNSTTSPQGPSSDLASPDVLDEHLGSYHVFSALTIEWTVLAPNNDEIYEQ